MTTVDPIHAIAAKRWTIALVLSAAMLAIYLGFILLVAFGKQLLSVLLGPGLSLGILLGALTIVSCWILSMPSSSSCSVITPWRKSATSCLRCAVNSVRR